MRTALDVAESRGFLVEGGEMGRLMRAHDWSRSSLGPPATWPQPLKTLVEVMLTANQPMFVAWGSDRTLLYNNPYIDVLADKHPALGRDFLDVWHEARSDLTPLVERAYRGEPSHADDIALYLMRKGYREETHFAYSYTPVRDESGAVAGLFCPFIETTEQVLAARRLTAERERQRRMLQQMPGFVALLTGPEHRFDYVNDAFVAISGPRDFIGRTVRAVFPEIAGQGFHEQLDRVYATGERFEARALPIRLAGESGERVIELLYEPIRDDDGAVSGIFVGGYDITERARAEQTLRASDARFRGMLDGMAEGFGLLGPDFTIIEFNAEAMRLETRPREAIIGKTHWDAYPGSEDSDVGRLYKRAMAERVPVAREHAYRWEDGREAWLDMRAYPIADGGLAVFWRDITDRKRADGDLRETEERLRLAVDNAEIGFWDVDVVNDLLIWPARTKAMFGISADVPVTMRDFYEGLHPDDHAITAAAYAAAADPARRALYDVEYRTVGKEDGCVRWVAAKGRGVFDAAGCCLRVAGTAIDITARKAAEERLRASEEFNRRVLASSADCIKVLDLDARLEFMSDGGMCVMEVDDFAQVEGAHWPGFWPGPEHGKALDAIAEAKRGGIGRFRGFARTMKGSPRWWDVAVTSINGADGRPEKLLSVSRDITQQHEAEERLRALNETLEAQVAQRTADLDRLWRSSHDLLMSARFDTTIVAVNPAWPQALGWSEAEMVGVSFVDFIHPDDLPTAHAQADALVTGARTSAQFELRYRVKQGGWACLAWSVAATDGQFHGIARDVTAERARQTALETAQEALRQSQKMEAMGSLTGGVAHDFNNLLTPIIGSLDMLARKGIGSERERRLIDGALQSAERAKTLVQRLLAFARRQPLQPVAVDVGRLVDGMVDLIGSTLGPTIDVRVAIAPDLPPARADPNQLEMALLNLAVNARDAMPGGGELRIAAVQAEVDGDAAAGLGPGPYLRLCVEDTGVGMDAATQARAIEPFFSTKGIGKGTGLGLSMVHGLAAQLGGGLTIDSAPDRGTRIALWLPVSSAAVDGAETTAPAPAPRAERGTALVVDDEELVRMSTAEMLIDLGFAVIEASTAVEALAIMARDGTPDLLVTDHLMPGMSGVELAREARALKPTLPILVVSGYADMDGIAPDLPRLTKPFRNAELAASVAALAPGR